MEKQSNNTICYNISNLKELNKTAKLLINNFKSGDVIELEGPMGSGKTTLIREIAILMGASITEIHSPTFNIFQWYDLKTKKKNSINKICHIDAWRLKDTVNLGFEELFKERKGNLFLIEWGKNIQSELPIERYIIEFEFINSDIRNLYISHSCS